jgi:MYXO-CTERM domain-containing protein
MLGLAVGGVLAVGLATAAHLHARPLPIPQFVSGAPLLKTAGDGAEVRWHETATTIYFDHSLVEFAPGAENAVQAGFGTWLGSGARVPDLSFDTTSDAHFGKAPNGRSEISYGRITVPGHEHDLALTITFSDQSTGEIVEADMIFNSEHPFGLLQNDSGEDGDATNCHHKYDLQAVATHEAGHFFGLGEDYDERRATMFYTTARCELHKRVLANSDVSTMTELYAHSDQSEGSTQGKACSLAGGAGGGGNAGLAALALLGFVAARRRRA